MLRVIKDFWNIEINNEIRLTSITPPRQTTEKTANDRKCTQEEER